MYSNCSSITADSINNTSTPKRRRLGTGRIVRKVLNDAYNGNRRNHDKNYVNKSSVNVDKFKSKSDLQGESSPLPCNQVEYLSESMLQPNCTMPANLTPGLSQCSMIREIESENWESPVHIGQGSKENISTPLNSILEQHEVHSISDDMFNSVLNPPQTSVSSKIDDYANQSIIAYKRDLEDIFEKANKTICDINVSSQENESILHFGSRDSFLLEFKDKEGCATQNNLNNNKLCKKNDSFYDLPLPAKSLFKMFRNINELYAWQEECLNLNAILERRNLIYALPTSGGKTLVAEILMMREVLNRRRNALLILPFVAIVQEKIWGLSPFAVQLEFLVEEYAAGKGLLPPKKRRKKNSIYVATIEKGLALVRSLVELKRLDELGLIVVDELHLIGEGSRGATLETLLSTIIFANQGIQIVGMSATIGNLEEIAKFLNAEVYQGTFRPVQLVEYVKLGDSLHKLQFSAAELEVTPCRVLSYDYSAVAMGLDPDWLGGLVSEVVPHASCLIFCPTKSNCENVAALLCKLQRKEMLNHQVAARAVLSAALLAEGGQELARTVLCGIAHHHAGLAGDERRLLEDAFRSGVISVLCCTSTLAAGVNLPAQRVIVRAPFVGREFLSLGAYRQMVGRAGRAGVCDEGESIIICSSRDWPRLFAVLQDGLAPARSALAAGDGAALRSLLLSAVGLGLATTRTEIQRLVACTLLQAQADSLDVCVKDLCVDSLRDLIKCGALIETPSPRRAESNVDSGQVDNDSVFSVSQLGSAAIKGCMEVGAAQQLREEARVAARGLVLLGALHLLYLVAPLEPVPRPDMRAFYSLYSSLDEEGVRTARALGITEATAIQMMTGKQITTVPERVLKKFYVSLMLRDLWNQAPVADVAIKYGTARGVVQATMSAAAAQAAGAQRLAEELPELWPYRALLAELAARLQHCVAPHLQHLMDLPGVKKARAMQLNRAGYKSIEDIAKAAPDDLAASVQHLSATVARQLISAAKMKLIEKVENLRAEAEEVMSQLNIIM